MATKKSTKNIKRKKSAGAVKASTKGNAAPSPKKRKTARPVAKPAKKKPASAAKKVAKKSSLASAKTTARKVANKPSAAARKTVAAKVSGRLPVPALKTEKRKKQKSKLTQRERIIQLIRTNLVRQKDTLLNEAEAALNELPGQTIFPDLGDQATAETDRNFMLRLRGREQRLLKKIDEAISRIDSGTFGICDDCGNEIETKRLEVRPVTTMCIECKTLQEEEEKLREV
jgi:RNA polymerase-binding transcription factor